MYFNRIITFCIGFIWLTAAPVLSATLTFEDGEWTGATGVNVAGDLYNVEITVGSCGELYDGCNEDSDFIINEDDIWVSALSELYNGRQDELSGRSIRGCSGAYCEITMPYMMYDESLDGEPELYLFSSLGIDQSETPSAFFAGGGFCNNCNASAVDVYAVWSPAAVTPAAVPLPASGLLLIFGVAGATTLRRTRKVKS